MSISLDIKGSSYDFYPTQKLVTVIVKDKDIITVKFA